MILSKPLKAYECENDPPYIGDIRPTIDYPAGTKFSEITQFEVWDGREWVSPDKTYVVQETK